MQVACKVAAEDEARAENEYLCWVGVLFSRQVKVWNIRDRVCACTRGRYVMLDELYVVYEEHKIRI